MIQKHFSKAFLHKAIAACLILCCNYCCAWSEEAKGATAASIDFIENKGQWPAPVRYKAELPGGALFLTDNGLVYNFASAADREQVHAMHCNRSAPQDSIDNAIVHYHAYKVQFIGAQNRPAYRTEGKRSYYHNYFIGNDRTAWAGHVPLFEKVAQDNIYPGISMVLYSAGASFKYDFRVAAGADPAQIILSFEGVQPELTQEGKLRIQTSVNEVMENAPYTYQVINGEKISVPCKYVLSKDGRLSFALPQGYNPAYELIIDPVLVFSTYSGSTGGDKLSYTTTYDDEGNLYAGSECASTGWPVTIGAYQQTHAGGGADVGINKYNATGSELLYSTYYGGTGAEVVNAMIVSGQELIITGSTTSPNLGVTSGCYDNTLGGPRDIYVTRFNSTGSSLTGGTYIGGSTNEAMNYVVYYNTPTMSPSEITLDGSGNIWVTSNTNSANFPVTPNALQPVQGGLYDAVVFELSPDCTQLLYSTYLGGTGNDGGYGIVPNNIGGIAVCGGTASANFPVTAGSVNTTAPGLVDAFVALINPATGALAHATYLGTPAADQAFRIQADENGNIYVLGNTKGNYPISASVYAIPDADIFISKLSADLTALLLSTRVGDPQSALNGFRPTAFLLDNCGNTYVAGLGAANNLPITQDAYASDPRSFWFCLLKPNFSDLKYASYFGSILPFTDHSHEGVHRFDPKGIIYHTVCSTTGGAGNFPITPGVVFPIKQNTGVDNLSFKFNFEAAGIHAEFTLVPGQNDTGCAPFAIQLVNNSTGADEYTWDFGDGSPASNNAAPSHLYAQPGVYTISLHAHIDSTCKTDDTAYMDIVVLSAVQPSVSVNDTTLCNYTQAITMHAGISNALPGSTIRWQPAAGIIGPDDQAAVTLDPSLNDTYYITVTDTVMGVCIVAATDTLHINYIPRALDILNNDSVVCQGTVVQVAVTATPGYTYLWAPDTGVSDTAAPEPAITVNQSAIYTLTASYPGCPDTAVMLSLGMEQYPVVTLEAGKTVCQWSEVALQSSITPYSSNYTYQWSPVTPNLQFSAEPNAAFTADTSITYSLNVHTPAGCSGSDSILVTVVPGNFGSISPDTGYCAPDTVLLQATGGIAYSWTPAYGLSDTAIATPLASPSTTTGYTVYVIDGHGCKDTLQVNVAVWPHAVISLPDSIDLYPGEQYHLEPATNCLYFSWFPPSGLSSDRIADPRASPEVRTRYFVTAVTEHGCTVTDSVDVLPHCTVMDMPNAFAPGGIANNTFRISKRGIAQLNSLMVFNRWGNKLFETRDIEKGWDGTYNGEPQPLGVYVYVVDAVSECGELYYKQGNVTLIR